VTWQLTGEIHELHFKRRFSHEADAITYAELEAMRYVDRNAAGRTDYKVRPVFEVIKGGKA
jgi:hypothetical protein